MAETEKKRGALLIIWLIIMLAGNLFSALAYLFLNSSIASFYPDVPSWIFYIYGFLGFANTVFVIFLFMWKKWPFFAFCGVAVIAFIMNLAIGLGFVTAIIGLLGPVILY